MEHHRTLERWRMMSFREMTPARDDLDYIRLSLWTIFQAVDEESIQIPYVFHCACCYIVKAYFPQLSCSNYAKHVIPCHVLCLKWSILFTAAIAPCFSSMFQDGVLGAVARPGTGRTLLEGVCRFVAG